MMELSWDHYTPEPLHLPNWFRHRRTHGSGVDLESGSDLAHAFCVSGGRWSWGCLFGELVSVAHEVQQHPAQPHPVGMNDPDNASTRPSALSPRSRPRFL